MFRISIVVPVYKVEKYLDRCVESLRAQTLSDIEIVLVDDGSPDRCPQMCDDWAKRDRRIRVVHKKNGGLSSARNAGMMAACGTYIGFVDSDDAVSPDMYEKMLAVMEGERVDFVMSDYIRVPASGAPYLKTLDIRGGRYAREDICREIFPRLIMGENLDYGPLLSVWHCLYRAEFLRANQLCFDEDVRWSEDNIFSAIVGYLDEVLFKYVIREESHSHSIDSSEKTIQQLKYFESILLETLKRMPKEVLPKYKADIQKRYARLRFGNALDTRNPKLVYKYLKELTSLGIVTFSDWMRYAKCAILHKA